MDEPAWLTTIRAQLVICEKHGLASVTLETPHLAELLKLIDQLPPADDEPDVV